MQGHRVVGRLILVGALLAVGACNRTFKKEAVQPNPLAQPTETLRSSERITIVTGDMELEEPDKANAAQNASVMHKHPYKLYNQASFTIVSRDRLRFHVQVDHKWEVSLEDDTGRHWVPESVEHAKTRIITTMWDWEQRTAICRDPGPMGRDVNGDCITLVGFQDDGWKRRQALGSLSVYRGTGDFVFYQRDLFTAAVRSLKLVVKRNGQAFEFKWKFEDTVATE
jgi:hypothetical protein